MAGDNGTVKCFNLPLAAVEIRRVGYALAITERVGVFVVVTYSRFAGRRDLGCIMRHFALKNDKLAKISTKVLYSSAGWHAHHWCLYADE